MKKTITANLLILLVSVISTIFFLYSCATDHKKQDNIRPIKVIAARGYVVPRDSMAEPKVIPLDENRLKKVPAGVPVVIPTNTNIHLLGKPKVLPAGTPKVIIPGTNSIPLPKTVPAISKPFVAGVPEEIFALDMTIKDQNPASFSTFGKLQGLKHSIVRCLSKDRSGNLWFGLDGGGACRYDGKFFTHYTETEGLTSNIVYSILEDKSGNLWIGTYGGVSKFDGKNITQFTEKEGLSNNIVLSIIEDKHGNLWFGTNMGVSKYDGKNFTQFTAKEGLSDNTVNSILEDHTGNLWFGTNGGVSKYDGKSFTQFTSKEGLSNNIVNSILEDKSGNFWFATWGGGISKYDGITFTHYTVKEGLPNDNALSITEDKSGNLWFGTYNGLAKYDGKSFTHFTDKEGLSNNSVLSILEDKHGNLWFGTYSGVSKYAGNSFTHFTTKEGLSNNIVNAILADKSGNLWFGTYGGGILKYDGHSFAHYFDKEDLSNNIVNAILEDKSGNLWFGSDGGVSKFNGTTFSHFISKEDLSNNSVSKILEDKSGNLWFGTAGGGVIKYNGKSLIHFTEKEGLSNNIVNTIMEDKSGNLWFGTYHGINKYDGRSFTHFTSKEGLTNNIVYSIIEDQSGNLWFGTGGGGVLEYDGKNFTNFTEKEGLSNNNVLSILEDRSGNLWFGTRFGLSELTRMKLAIFSEKIRNDGISERDVIFKNFTNEDGFSGVGCNRNSILEAKDGTIWIGSNNRLTVYHPENEIMDTITPNIHLTTIELYNENISWSSIEQNKDSSFILRNGVKVGNIKFDGLSGWYILPENLSLAYNNNYLTFNFISITQKQAGRLKYQYKLEGNDKNWSAITNRNSASYGNLPQGTYTFKVKAMNSEGYWSPEFNYTFRIRPPWWKTWWMYTFYGLAAVACVVLITWWNGRRLRARAKKLKTEVEKATIEIRNQKEIVETEKKKSDELLLNILPSEIANELKQTGRSQAKTFSMVSVMFADFKDFTKVSEMVSAELLVDEINYCFSAFDRILPKYNVEKIKTIGDAYMCASGLPVLNYTHAIDLVNASLEIRDFMLARKTEKVARGEIPFELRIGIHTGPVVAGIVGVKKFQYDIWGDTVNVAARMEASDEPGKVNVSGSTYELVKDKFTCIHRGKIDAKHKGEIDMYFVEH